MAWLGTAYLGTAWLGDVAAQRAWADPPASGQANPPVSAQIVEVHTMPPIALGALQNAARPDSLRFDRGFALGSVGSDMWRDTSQRSAASSGFWMITDRGPNGHVEVGGEKHCTFPTPDFAPMIIRATARAGSLDLQQVIPITGRNGRPVTGLPNLSTDEAAYDYAGETILPPDPRGIDPEGLVHTSRGDFWIVEEYRPSLLHVDGQGRILTRYVPEGHKLEHVDYAVEDSLPAVYGQRRKNRGFEGLAMSGDEKLLYLLLESPLENPDPQTAERSRNGRILVFDTIDRRCVGEYVYHFETAQGFDENCQQVELRACAIAWFAPDQFLVVERNDKISKVFEIDLRPASNLLAPPWRSDCQGELETLEDPAAAGIQLPLKRQLLDLSKFPDMPLKIEGLAIIDSQTIAVSNDNDFSIGQFSPAGKHIGGSTASQVVVVRLARPLGSRSETEHCREF